ncbi:MAG: alkaline phosphatase family protein [Erysipelotrichaceae bacterium]
MKKLLVVSFDAVNSQEFSKEIATLPNMSKLLSQGTLVSDVDSVFISNTYVCHTSMITGVYPEKHGIIDNTAFEPNNTNPHWNWYYNQIKAPHIMEKALALGYSITNLFWPVMAKAPFKYNLPEIIARDHENQILTILKNGTPGFIIKYLLKNIKHFKGIDQPSLDNISTAVACDVLKKAKTDLVFLHLTDTDMKKHFHGTQSNEAKASLQRMDERLGKLLKACKEQYSIMIVSDHSQIDIHTNIDLNKEYPLDNAWWYQSEGLACLLHKEKLTKKDLKQLNNWANNNSAIKKIVSAQELKQSGLKQKSDFAIIANAGYCFIHSDKKHKACHGFSLDIKDDYKTFYFIKDTNVQENQILTGGSILDICAVLTKILEIEPWPIEGKLNNKIFKKSAT